MQYSTSSVCIYNYITGQLMCISMFWYIYVFEIIASIIRMTFMLHAVKGTSSIPNQLFLVPHTLGGAKGL